MTSQLGSEQASVRQKTTAAGEWAWLFLRLISLVSLKTAINNVGNISVSG